MVFGVTKVCPVLGAVTFPEGGRLGFCFGCPIEEADNLILIHAARLDTPPGVIRRVRLTFRRCCPNTAQDM